MWAVVSLGSSGRAVAIALALLPFLLGTDIERTLATHSGSTIGLLALDAGPEGNNPTSLGQIDGCARVDAGSSVMVDYVVDSIPLDRPMIAFEAQIRYDPQLLEVVDLDHDLMLAAAGAYSPFAGLSDDLPDSDGDFRISVLDTASSAQPEANVESGAGVLARITFRAKAAGLTNVAIAVETEPLIYPLVQDTHNEMIFVDRLGSASVAVGQDCPPQALQPKIHDLAPISDEILAANPDLRASATPVGSAAAPESSPNSGDEALSPAATATPFADTGTTPKRADDGSSDAGLIVAVVLLVTLCAVGAGGWLLYRWLRNSLRAG